MNKLFIHFSNTPQFVYYAERPKIISIGKLEFVDKNLGEWTGFYDWLRTASGKIIGVRYWPFEQAEFLLKAIQPSSVVQLDSKGAMLIFFSDEVEFVQTLSGDQAFEESSVFVSNNGEYGILFGCSDLSDEECATLRAAAA